MKKTGVEVRELLDKAILERFSLEFVAGDTGLSRLLQTSRIQKPGLLLTGMLEELHSDRLQIFGAAEVGFLRSLSGETLEKTLEFLARPAIPGIVVTRGLPPPDFLARHCSEKGIPLFRTKLTSSVFIEGLTRYLDDRLAPTTTLHGVLVDVLGVGVLVTGKSGIGKSECALELVSRGYRLVADDVVLVKRMARAILYGMSTDPIRYHMEIRGLGILNIMDLYGITAIREKKQMDIVVELVKWEEDGDYERLGFEENAYEVLGVKLPHLRIPVSPGRSVATIVEVAARNQILKIMGHDSARLFRAGLDDAMRAAERALEEGEAADSPAPGKVKA